MSSTSNAPCIQRVEAIRERMLRVNRERDEEL